MKPSATLLFVLSTTLALPVVAQDPAASSPDELPLPEVRTENDVKYMCGGIGMTESAHMKKIAPAYDLMLTFAADNGAYLAAIDVEIAKDRAETLVAARCDGPIMLVDVPRGGLYRITAETRGHKVTRSVRVRDGQAVRRLLFSWPASLVGGRAGDVRDVRRSNAPRTPPRSGFTPSPAAAVRPTPV